MTSPKACGKKNSPKYYGLITINPKQQLKRVPFVLHMTRDAMIPVEVGEPLTIKLFFQAQQNKENMKVELEMKNEVQEIAKIKEEATKL